LHRSAKVAIGLAGVVLVSTVLAYADALVDDFEDDFWLPFTHFNLGDKASAGYATGIANSGSRSYHVGILGWTRRDFGSAYGYAFYATRGAALTELRLALNHAILEDVSPSPWDAFSAGLEIQLLDSDYRSLGRYRYVTAFRASENAGRCGPTTSDVVVGQTPELGVWQEVSRNPAADFPSAPWATATFAKIAVGFLCATGLTGATYSLYFDDFAADTDAGDSDGDGFGDLEEEILVHTAEIESTSTPMGIASGQEISVSIDAPSVSGMDLAGAVRLEIEHDRASNLSVAIAGFDGVAWGEALLWDPGFHARGVAILSPRPGQVVHGVAVVSGRTSSSLAASWAHLYVDGAWETAARLGDDGSFAIPWVTDPWSESVHDLAVRISAAEEPGGDVAAATVQVIVDRTPPELVVVRPAPGSEVSGLTVVEAQASDPSGIDRVELSVDGVVVETRREEPYAFAYETLDVPNGLHSLEVRAIDAGGNLALRSVEVTVNNQAAAVPPPCLPACTFPSSNPMSDLELTTEGPAARIVVLANGDRLRIAEGFRVPWQPIVLVDGTSIILVLDLFPGSAAAQANGLVGSSLTAEWAQAVAVWRITVRDHGAGDDGELRSAALLLAGRTSAGARDTDGDGMDDAAEAVTAGTSPVLRDSDDDSLPDGTEVELREIRFTIDGISVDRWIRTNPLDPDSDGDGPLDGIELVPMNGDLPTDPTDEDTDDDSLLDGLERQTYGSDPTRTDTDEDGLGDGYEVVPRTLHRNVNGTAQVWQFVTSPILVDTDDDRLTDFEEERGSNPGGIVTRPDVVDTDGDGLTDYEEIRSGTDGFQTEPLEADTDGDGVWDTFDKLPLAMADVGWKTEYPPGLVRFEQEMLVYWLRGIQAVMTRYDAETDSCPEVSNDVEGSTKSSLVTTDTVVSSINSMFEQGGELRYQATASREGDPSWTEDSVYSELIGACGQTPDQFYIAYEIHRDAYIASFKNVQTVTIEDEWGRPFSYAFIPLPIDPARSFSLILQFSVDAGADRAYRDTDENWLAPAFSYVVFGGVHSNESAVLYSSTAFGTELNEHAYRVEMRVPGAVLPATSIEKVDGIPTVGFYFSPQWLGRYLANPWREALDPASMRIAAISTERPSAVSLLTVRFEVGSMASLLDEVDSLSTLETGYHGTESGMVYVYRTSNGERLDARAPDFSAAILIVSESEDQLFAARDSIDWGQSGTWFQDIEDPWGKPVKAFRDSVKIVRAAVTVGHFLNLLSYRFADPGAYVYSLDPENLILVEKGTLGEETIFTVSEAISQDGLRFDVTESGELVVRRQTFYRITRSEITTDLSGSQILVSRYAIIKNVLRGLGATAVLVTNGREAIIAFHEGDFVKGLVYTSNAAVGVFGVFRGEATLASVLGSRNARLASITIGKVAVIASGALMAGYELSAGFQAIHEIDRRGHFERAAGLTIDTAISIIPTYGATIVLAWSLTNLGMSLVLPNKLAARITSTPGTTIIFLLEYFLGGTIPAEIAQSVLDHALEIMISHVRTAFGNLGLPAAPVFP